MSEVSDQDWEDRRRFFKTDVGKALRRYALALGQAWRTDVNEACSATEIARDWNEADAAEAALIAKIEKLMGGEPDRKPDAKPDKEPK